MEKSSFIKFAKITGAVVGVAFLSLMVWANWEAKGYTQTHVADSQFIVYDVSNFKNDNSEINIEKAVASIDGVSTCSYNSAKKFIGVIFYTSKLTSDELQEKIGETIGFKPVETQAPQQKNGCPVGGVRYFILNIKHVLNFRS